MFKVKNKYFPDEVRIVVSSVIEGSKLFFVTYSKDDYAWVLIEADKYVIDESSILDNIIDKYNEKLLKLTLYEKEVKK